MSSLQEKNVRMILIQFRVNNPAAIPNGLRENNPRPNGNQHQPSGVQFINPAETNVSMKDFRDDLKNKGFVLVDAFRQTRKNSAGANYTVARFIFCDQKFADPSPEFKANVALCILKELCEKAHWNVIGYANPFFREQEEVPDQYVLSINANSPRYLFEKDGRQVCVWQKDVNGNKIGDRPLPLMPQTFLRIRGDDIKVERL